MNIFGTSNNKETYKIIELLSINSKFAAGFMIRKILYLPHTNQMQALKYCSS